jgi:hypothetical protein
MKAAAFFELVRQMRNAQETYYAKRMTSNLIKARELERSVDRVLGQGLEPEPAIAAKPEDDGGKGQQIEMIAEEISSDKEQ